MMRRFFLTLFLLWVLINSCQNKTGQDIKVKYSYLTSDTHSTDSINDKRNGIVILGFISNYEHDTIGIKFEEIDTTLFLSTSNIVGTAGLFPLGRFNNGKSIELKLNRFKPINIKVDENNQIFLINYADSILTVKSVYHIPSAE